MLMQGQDGWIILRTAGRSTLRLATSLAEDGFKVWAPVETVGVVLPGSYHKRPGTYALIPQYVFARGHHDQDLLRLSNSRHGHPDFTVVMRADQIARVADAALEPLRDAEAVAGIMAVPRKRISPYSRGAKVRVRKGIYADVSGEVETSDGKEAKIWISMFGRHQKVTLPIYFLEDEEQRKAA
jgi:transcription antitermination factor NusG